MRNFQEFFSRLIEYKNEYGNCLVPSRYITEDGYKLGQKICGIRCKDTVINEYEEKKLREIGFVWKVNSSPKTFEEKLTLILEYKNKFQSCYIPRSYVTESGERLGEIVANLKYGKNKLTPEQEKIIEKIGLRLLYNRKPVRFEELYNLLVKYKGEYGDCLVPQKYITNDGIKLGVIVASVRQRKAKLKESQIKLLEELGFVWKAKNRKKFEEIYELFLEYKEEHGNLLIPMRYETEDGIKLGAVVANIRGGKIKLDIEQKELLDSIGFVWQVNKKCNK